MQQHQDSIISTVETIESGASFVTRQDINNFPFPYKLWLVVHLDFCDFLRWNRDGTVILLDLVALEDYLNSTRSIFKIKNRSIFLEHLEQFKFERLNATPEAEEDLLMQYKNENFQRHRLDLLAKIRRRSSGSCQSQTFPLQAELSPQAVPAPGGRVVERMLGDLCFMSHGALSNIQKSRMRFQTILNFQNETRILQEKLQASDEHAAAQLHQRRFKTADAVGARIGNAIAAAPAMEEEQVIELPVELFENPHDSVLHLGEDFRPEYAGYYGNCSKNQILHFFGDYLPMYEDGSMEVKKIVTEVSGNNSFALNTEVDQSLVEQTSCNDDEESKLPMSAASMNLPQKSMPSLNLSSTLEPIFKQDDEEDNQMYSSAPMMTVNNINNNNINNSSCNNNNNNEIELELSMEEFIKFKDTNDIEMNMKIEQPTSPSDEFPQMPAAVKLEITDEDDSENEANFRNFFSQYRASLNLLYERH